MVYVGSFLKVVDNSGARLVKCLKIYSKLQKSRGVVGDLLLVSVRQINPKKNIKRGELFKGMLVRTNKFFYRYGGIIIYFKTSSIVLFNKRENLAGTRILEPVAYELRNLNQFKLVSLAPACI